MAEREQRNSENERAWAVLLSCDFKREGGVIPFDIQREGGQTLLISKGNGLTGPSMSSRPMANFGGTDFSPFGPHGKEDHPTRPVPSLQGRTQYEREGTAPDPPRELQRWLKPTSSGAQPFSGPGELEPRAQRGGCGAGDARGAVRVSCFTFTAPAPHGTLADGQR